MEAATPGEGRLFAFIADHRDWLGCIVSHRPQALDAAARSGRGWSLVFCQDGDVLLRSHPESRGADEGFLEIIRSTRTRAVLGHLSSRDPEGPHVLEAMALRSMGWIFAQDVETDGFEKVREKVRRSIPDFLARTMKTRGEAEHLFTLILAFLYDSGKLSDPDLPAAELVRGVANALRMLGEIYPPAGLEPPTMALAVSNCYSAAGFTGSSALPVRIYSRPTDGEVHRGVGVRRGSGEFPRYPRTGNRAVLIGPFIEGEEEGAVTTTLPPRTVFGITRECEIQTQEI